MPSRKYHTKTRHGCIECKAKKVKCDQAKPVCSRCIRCELQCHYQILPISPQSPRILLPTNYSSPNCSDVNVSPSFAPVPTIIWTIPTLPPTWPESIPPLDASAIMTVSDIELMHYYSMIRFSPIARDSEIWTQVAPREAFKHRFLLHGVLAHAALFKGHLNPSTASDDVILAMQHFSSAIRLFQPVLNDIRPDNAVAAFLLASLMVPISWGMPVVQRASQGIVPRMQPAEVMQHLFDILRLQRGMSHISTTGWPYLQEELAPLFDLQLNPPGTIFPDEEEAVLGKLEECVLLNVAGETEERKQVYVDALGDFRRFYPTTNSPNAKAMIHSWPTKVSPSFLQDMNERIPVAIIFLAYHGALLSTLPDCFWLGDAGKMLVLAVDELLPPGFEEAMEWPKSQVGIARKSWDVVGVRM
ncbi:hypothetical protein VTL71DRAFT_15845 [Oculimacula yallundae]|uniref:Zn(2)-C6 fungal-type domain-containing protein n=1 Tax=Oculimacula yallundae TaxID=86028 RepID=A0ABR4CCS9_9HELO